MLGPPHIGDFKGAKDQFFILDQINAVSHKQKIMGVIVSEPQNPLRVTLY